MTSTTTYALIRYIIFFSIEWVISNEHGKWGGKLPNGSYDGVFGLLERNVSYFLNSYFYLDNLFYTFYSFNLIHDVTLH